MSTSIKELQMPKNYAPENFHTYFSRSDSTVTMRDTTELKFGMVVDKIERQGDAKCLALESNCFFFWKN